MTWLTGLPLSTLGYPKLMNIYIYIYIYIYILIYSFQPHLVGLLVPLDDVLMVEECGGRV